MRFWNIAALLLLIFLPFQTATAAEATIQTTPTQAVQPRDTTQYLLVQHSAKATIAPTAGKQTFTITLHEVAPYLAYFSDRPNRKTGTISLTEFLKFWDKRGAAGFKNNPPNAYFNAMEIGTSTSGLEGIKDFPVELTNPQYDSQTRTLSYTAIPLPGTTIPNTATLNYITLFIDDVCLSCW